MGTAQNSSSIEKNMVDDTLFLLKGAGMGYMAGEEMDHLTSTATHPKDRPTPSQGDIQEGCVYIYIYICRSL